MLLPAHYSWQKQLQVLLHRLDTGLELMGTNIAQVTPEPTSTSPDGYVPIPAVHSDEEDITATLHMASFCGCM
jgi:hypothetical protein